jgi:hypothetical protein
MPQMVQEVICQPGGLSQVPSRFIQPVEERPQRTDCSGKPQGIPVIDMEGMAAADSQRREHVVAEIARACEHWGFFQVCELYVTQTPRRSF